MPTETFKSEDAYRRYRAYTHMHGIKAPGLKRVCIKGKGCHEVKHGKKSKARKRSYGKA